MALAVYVPKQVAIRNKRLAICHFSMVGLTSIALLLFKLLSGSLASLKVACHSQLELAWDTDASIRNMENFFALRPDIAERCQAGAAGDGQAQTRTRWGHEFDLQGSCTRMCTLDLVLLHQSWARNSSTPPLQRLCWTDFKSFGPNRKYTALQFLESQGGQSATLITAKNDWVVNHRTEQKTNLQEVVPQGVVAQLGFKYSYSFAQPPWFLWSGQQAAKNFGTNRDAQTLILDAYGAPWGDLIPPGAGISISVEDVWKLARSSDGKPLGSLDHSTLATGAVVHGQARCYTADEEIVPLLGPDSQDWRFGASLHQPVCVLNFVLISRDYQVQVNYGSADDNYTSEVVSETAGLFFRALAAAGTVQLYDLRTFLLEITSMLVLLALPTQLTSFIACYILGPLSGMYGRVIIEPYDIEEATASAMTVLAVNTRQFHEMKVRTSDGKEVVTLAAIRQRLAEALEARVDTMNEREVTSLAVFCYEAMAQRELATEDNEGFVSFVSRRLGRGLHDSAPSRLSRAATGLMKSTFRSSTSSLTSLSQAPSIKNQEGITLDQFNQVRLDSEKVTFDAVVQLFDKDRRRTPWEVFFTPDGIQRALHRALDDKERVAVPSWISWARQVSGLEPGERNDRLTEVVRSLGRSNTSRDKTVRIGSKTSTQLARPSVTSEKAARLSVTSEKTARLSVTSEKVVRSFGRRSAGCNTSHDTMVRFDSVESTHDGVEAPPSVTSEKGNRDPEGIALSTHLWQQFEAIPRENIPALWQPPKCTRSMAESHGEGFQKQGAATIAPSCGRAAAALQGFGAHSDPEDGKRILGTESAVIAHQWPTRRSSPPKEHPACHTTRPPKAQGSGHVSTADVSVYVL